MMMERSIETSVVMATYNGMKYLSQQLESIAEQTELPGELVIFDDASSDDTTEIVAEFASHVPFPVILKVNETRQGYARNFSSALLAARGAYIFLADQDDVWSPNKIERILDVFESQEKARLVIHDLDFCRADLSKIGQTKIERMSPHYNLMNSFVTGMATAVESDFLSLCLPVPTDEGFAHDTWIHKCAMLLGVKVIVHESLALYRRHEANATAMSELNALDMFPSKIAQRQGPSFFDRLLVPTEIGKNDLQVYSKWIKQLDMEKLEEMGVSRDLVQQRATELSNRSRFIERRRKLLGERRLIRILDALTLARDGGYVQHNGLSSLLKDLFGP